ncbi:MAG TPA: hydroxymethylbilane synthase [Blattabacteriaceae bacterium]|jgi:hydroxymethylbilane synthase|nr:hydroxymethylbilane synthase [Blattabacteriaceae bacterium]
MAKLRIGSRGSQLALWQANHVAALLRAKGHTVEIEVIKTTGDKITSVALAKVGTKGMFTKEIEDALHEKRVDLAVHSLKDVPTDLAQEFELAAIMKREDPRDAFISVKFSSLEELPQRAKVGTSSLRRQCQLKAMRPDLEVFPLRGNVDTRLRKLESGEYDAIILAAAGVLRLGLETHVRSRISADVMCPAVGQGALAIEIRRGDQQTKTLLAFLNDADTHAAIDCERALLGSLGGGCQVPIGAYAEKREGRLFLRAMVGRPDGSQILREQADGTDGVKLGRETAQTLLWRGGDKILDDVYAQEVEVPKQP